MAIDTSKFQKGLDIATGAAGLLTQTIQKGTAMADVPNEDIQEEINDLSSVSSNASSYRELLNRFNSTNWARTNYNMWDLTGMNGGEAAGRIALDTLGGAAAGAQFGTQIMPGIGTAIGAVVGGAADALSSGFGWLSRKVGAHNNAQKYNYEGRIANELALNTMKDNAINIGKAVHDQALYNRAAFGGPLDTNFSNGVRFITEGGSHEQNPLGGVFQGIASDGIPNLVEEGEVIYNDYVYSKRLKVPQADKENLGLKKDKEYTYADAAKQIQKESEERPNDPISKRNLAEMMSRLQDSQEVLKEKRDGQALKRAVNKMTPDELAMFMQQLQQPQQMQPMMAMQSMQPMQPTQSEVPMFGKGGHLFAFGDTLNWNYPTTLPDLQSAYEAGLFSDLNTRFQQAGINAGVNVFDTTKPLMLPELTYNAMLEGEAGEAGRKTAPAKKSNTPAQTSGTNNSSAAQALRAAPVFGSLASSIASLFDKPNYSNIERAERAMDSVPMVSAGHVGQRLSYTPVDINYLMTQTANQGLGARRALVESGAGPQAIIASNYGTQTAIGQNLLAALVQNEARRAQVAEFNRGTETTNIGNDLNAALANQQRDANYADFLFRTGQLRDAELGRVQANRSTNLTNLSNNLGNLGQDMLNREQAAAVAASLGVTYNDLMKALALTSTGKNVGAKGGKLNTKKGGKDA